MQIEKLTNCEEIVMRAVWDLHKEPELADVFRQTVTIYGKDWRPQTLSTYLAKLCRKKYLMLQRNGRIYTYKILISSAQYNKEQLKRLYVCFYKNDVAQIKKDMEELLYGKDKIFN